MLRVLPWVMFLYLVALHCSIAAMEMFGWLTVVLAFGYRIKRRDFGLVRSNRVLALWLSVFVASVAIGLLLNPSLRPFWFQLGYMRWVILLWGLAFALEDVWDDVFEKKFRNFWMALTAITGFYGGLQFFTGIDLIRKGKVYYEEGGVYKATGWFSFSLTYAYSMGLQTLGISVPAIRSEMPRIGMVTVLCGSLGILAAMSRGAWIGAIVCLLIYLWFNMRWFVIPAVVAVALGALGLSLWSWPFYHKIHDMILLKANHSEYIRFDLWRSYWAMFLDHPLFGVGFLQGDHLLIQYYDKLKIAQDYTSHAHSNYLQFLAGTGLAGFTCYMAVIWIFLRKAWRLRKITAWGWSLFLAQVFIHIGGLTEANFIDAEITHFMVFIWAMLLMLERKKGAA